MQIDDKFVAIKVPIDLHKHLKAKAKESGMTLGNYLFDCICQYHNIKYVPASVEIPVKEAVTESPVSEEIQKDIDVMEKEEVVEEPAFDEVPEPVIKEPVVEEPVVEEPKQENPNVGG